jgi:hypothetical protein
MQKLLLTNIVKIKSWYITRQNVILAETGNRMVLDIWTALMHVYDNGQV